MKKARNFIGAVAIALAFMPSPAPAESAAPPGLVQCTLIRTGRVIHVPRGVALLLIIRGVANCEIFRG